MGAAGGVACALLVVGLLGRWGPLVHAALSVVVVAYAGALLERGAFDRLVPLVAAGLVLAGELAYTSIEPPARRTWPFAVATVAGAAALAALLAGAAGAGEGALRELVVGVAAAAGALALVAWLAVSAARSGEPRKARIRSRGSAPRNTPEAAASRPASGASENASG